MVLLTKNVLKAQFAPFKTTFQDFQEDESKFLWLKGCLHIIHLKKPFTILLYLGVISNSQKEPTETQIHREPFYSGKGCCPGVTRCQLAVQNQ